MDPLVFRRILDAGWWGQMKVQGHRVQIHISADPKQPCLAFTRLGKLHVRKLDPELEAELRRILTLKHSWSAIEAEWLKDEKKLFIFDYIKFNGEVLSACSYKQRYEMLPRIYQSPHVSTLPVLRTVTECMTVAKDASPHVEGLVFKSIDSIGFANHSMIRCRKQEFRYQAT